MCNLSKNPEESFFLEKCITYYLTPAVNGHWMADHGQNQNSDVAMAFPMHAYDMAPVTMARIIMNEKHETCRGL